MHFQNIAHSMTSDDSDSETGSDDEHNNAPSIQMQSSVSLGQIIPTHQRNSTVQTDYVRSYPVIIHSRDRNLFSEHLFSFRLLFGATNQPCKYSTCDTRHTEEAIHKRQYAYAHRRCAIEQTFTEVRSLHMTDILLPHASFLQSVTHPLDTTKIVSLATPTEVLIQLTPNNGKALLGTNNTSNLCNFACAQVATSSTHSRYKTLHHPFQNDTPVNFLNNIMFQ